MDYGIIKEARKQKGMTMKELAEKIGKYSPYIAEIEAGKRDLRISNVEKICEALDLEITIKHKKTMNTPDEVDELGSKVEIIKAGFLHKDYLKLKEQRNALYIFDFGGFYIAYDEDAMVFVNEFQETTLHKVKSYYMTSYRSSILGGLSLKIDKLLSRGYEVVVVRP